MRKLQQVTFFLFCIIGSLTARETTLFNRTYSVEAEAFPTNFGNYFAYYHVNLELADLTRVAKNGNLRILVEYQKGMEVSETHFEKKPNGGIYYVSDITTPTYQVKVFDQTDKMLLEKTYGGTTEQADFGRELNYPESVLAAKWLNEKDAFFQQLEFKNLSFEALEDDLIEIVDALPAPELTPKKINRPIRPKKESVILSNPRRPAQTETTETTEMVVPLANENTATQEEKMVEETMTAKEPQVTEKKVATKEEDMVKNPFPELNEVVNKEPITEAEAPPAPKDFDKSMATAQPSNSAIIESDMAKEGLVNPVLSNRKNIVKLNLPNLTFGNITLNYERVLSPRNSATLNIGYIRPQTLSTIVADETWNNSEFSGMTATAEYRVYSRKRGAPRGFYYAPYLRYANYKLAYQGDIDENLTDVSAKIATVGIGGQIGVQWLIKDRISIDWGILGLAVQQYNFSSTFKAAEGEEIDFEEVRAELEQEIEDSPINNKLKIETGDDFLKAKMPFLFGGARSYLTIGYSF